MKWQQRDDGVWEWRGSEPPRQSGSFSWRQAFAMGCLTAAMISIIPLLILGFAYRDATNERLNTNKEAIARERELRQQLQAQQNRLETFTAGLQLLTDDLKTLALKTCLANEKQDTVIVSILQSLIPRDQWPPVVQEGIDALEPEGETPCKLP